MTRHASFMGYNARFIALRSRRVQVNGKTEGGPGLHRVLLTGGPCAGKTTMMAKLT